MNLDILSLFGIKTTTERKNKGESLLMFADDYTIVDLETTGFSPLYDSIIEIGAIKVRNNLEVDRFHSFVHYGDALDPFVVEHTGITDDMLKGAPELNVILKKLLDFIGNDIVVAHNANFDINFIYDDSKNCFDIDFTNNFIDTMRIAKKCNLEIENLKLTTLAPFFNIKQETAHRSVADCETTFALYNVLRDYVSKNNIILKYKPFPNRIAGTTANVDNINPDNPFFGKTVVFTGALDSMERKTAAQIVANLGGFLGDNVSKKTNYLVLGNLAYCSTIKGGKSTKQKRAEQLIIEGADLQIISESVFLSMVNDEA